MKPHFTATAQRFPWFKISPWRKGIEGWGIVQQFHHNIFLIWFIMLSVQFQWRGINNFVYLFCFLQSRLQVVNKALCSCLLCSITYAWFYTRFVCLFVHALCICCCIPSSVWFSLYPFFIIDLFLNYFSLTVGYYYFFSNHIKRSVVYGDQPRNRCVMYVMFDGALNCHFCQMLVPLLSLTWVVDKIFQIRSVFTQKQWWAKTSCGICNRRSLDHRVSISSMSFNWCKSWLQTHPILKCILSIRYFNIQV